MKRLVALIPPKSVHLTRLQGVFAPNAKLRAQVVRAAVSEPERPAAAGLLRETLRGGGAQ